ncbi:MAG: hypothetical protein MK188_15745, partial [Gammaproteobacteria bacterium]|nr:hypothetical protein [Gammaproteobacteria bacterium]
MTEALFKPILVGEYCLLIVGIIAITAGSIISTAAVAVPLSPRLEVKAPEIVEIMPSVEPVTSTDTVQLEFAARVAPDKLTAEEPEIAVSEPDAQLVTAFAGFAISIPFAGVAF